jgi:hypothetical protein
MVAAGRVVLELAGARARVVGGSRRAGAEEGGGGRRRGAVFECFDASAHTIVVVVAAVREVLWSLMR